MGGYADDPYMYWGALGVLWLGVQGLVDILEEPRYRDVSGTHTKLRNLQGPELFLEDDPRFYP